MDHDTFSSVFKMTMPIVELFIRGSVMFWFLVLVFRVVLPQLRLAILGGGLLIGVHLLAEYGAFGQKHASVIKGGNALQLTPTAKTVRVRSGEAITTDGPFAETKEHLGGYYLIEANSPEEAAAIAAGIPAARYGSIEVRPIMVFS